MNLCFIHFLRLLKQNKIWIHISFYFILFIIIFWVFLFFYFKHGHIFNRYYVSTKCVTPSDNRNGWLGVKHQITYLLTVLLKVYNHVWESGCFPPSWREAVVIPIPKPGKDHSDPGNFRPLAFVCVKRWRGWSTLASCGPSSRRVFFPRSSATSERTTVRWIISFVLKCLLEMP